MKRSTRLFITLLFFVLPPFSYAQTVAVKGTVLDAHTREPVAFASIYLTFSTAGKISDTAGNFTLYLNPESDDTLNVSFVGYRLFRLPLKKIDFQKPLMIEMERGKNNSEVIIRTKINKGLFLWKKIMSKKKLYNRYNLSNFGYESYNKLEVDLKNFKADKLKKNFILKSFSFVFDNIDSTSEKEPFLPAYLIENLSDYAYQRNPKKFRETIKASQTKGFKNESINKLLGVMNQNVNIYNNYVNVMDKDFISPFNDNGDTYYNFNVPDTQMVNGVKVFHFTFTPKRPGQNTFRGDAWVISQTFQIEKITMFIGKDANINFIDRLSIFQEFRAINDTVYFLTRDKFFADFKTLG
ncbi:MAG: carboxypeptidase-like regulatory domain-containing protein, partial [Ferruginibacter sp.]|nr:carboxypeptidase-like regulatory domain-containing protein [Ferruginibacter sp.]